MDENQLSVESAAPQEQLPNNQTGQSQEQQTVSRDEYEKLQKQVRDNQAWATKLAQENAELKKFKSNLEQTTTPTSQQPPVQMDEYGNLFYPEQIKAIEKLSEKMAEKKARDIVQNTFGNYIQKQQEEAFIENYMNTNYPDYSQVKKVMAQEFNLLQPWEKEIYDKGGLLAVKDLYNRVKSKYNNVQTNNSGVVQTNGKPGVPSSKVAITPEMLDMAAAMGISKEQLEATLTKRGAK